jgi:hypothetical protein
MGGTGKAIAIRTKPMLQVLRRLFTPPLRSKKALRLRWVAPQVEQFEPRLVPAVYTWLGVPGNLTASWDDPTNWNINGFRGTPANNPPGFGDDVIIDGFQAGCPCEASTTLTDCASLYVTHAGRLQIGAGVNLIVRGDASMNSGLSDGTIQIRFGATLTVAGDSFIWSGGRFTGGVNGDGTLAVTGGSADASAPVFIIMGDAATLAANLVVGSSMDGSSGSVIVQNLNQDLTIDDHDGIGVSVSGTLTFQQASGNIVCARQAPPT